MHRLYDDERYEDGVQSSNVLMALEAAMMIQKKKVLVGPNDSVGILFYNTVRISPRIPDRGTSHYISLS